MDGILKFFVNAIKAILLSPIYIICFCAALIGGFINHLICEVRVLFSGFKFSTEKENKYTNKLENKLNQGGSEKWFF